MTEVDFERSLQRVNHSELSSGHDVTQLLSQINEDFKRAKADQILRLLRDQDKLNEQLNDCELIEEYNKITEEKVVCDSDTLTISSCDDSDNNEIQDETACDNAVTEVRRFRSGRCRTSMGFNNNNTGNYNGENSSSNMTDQRRMFDTRDLSVRPKSSYYRRRTYNHTQNDESEMEVSNNLDDDFVEPTQRRMCRSAARPKSRLGRSSVPRSERRIALTEAETVTLDQTESGTTSGMDLNKSVTVGNDRQESTRVPVTRRDSKRVKGFCDDGRQQSVDNMSIDTRSSSNSMDVREETAEIQTFQNHQVSRSSVQGAKTPNHFNNNAIVPHNSPVQTSAQKPFHRPSHKTEVVANQSSQYHADSNNQRVSSSTHGRTDASVHNADIQPEYNGANVSDNASTKRVDSHYGRPKNPEPIQSRPLGRADVRPNTRRRLQRRYMQQTSNVMSSVRPTSESVILARQRTEKNLIKKQVDNRPQSEKIMINPGGKNILSIASNPTQGPQTNITAKSGVTQSSHVQAGGFRGYDPTRHKSSHRNRDLQPDMALPRPGPNNPMFGGNRKPLALMKLPPLEASLAAKKKERGLAIAARETCV